MRKIVVAVLSLALLAQPVLSEQMVKPGTCELIVAARPTLSEARAYVKREISNTQFTKIFKAQNGWYAISIGALKPDEEKPVMTKWKSSGRIPQDSYCSTGKKYTALFDWRTGEKIQASYTASRRSASDNPFYHPGKCRMLYIETPSKQAAIAGVKDTAKENGWLGGFYIEIYRLNNGNYAAAESFRLAPDPDAQLRSAKTPAEVTHIKRYIGNGWYHSTARCTDGSDIAQATGESLVYDKKSSGLIVQIISGLANASRSGNGSGGSSSPSSGYKPTYSYELLCADDRLFGDHPTATIPLGQCTGYESECEYQLEQQLHVAGDYWYICSKTFGSNEWEPKGVRRQQ